MVWGCRATGLFTTGPRATSNGFPQRYALLCSFGRALRAAEPRAKLNYPIVASGSPDANKPFPRTRSGTVNRRGLVNLVTARGHAIVAISAPAGYGKTTLMVESARLDTCEVVWVSLDDGDNDITALLRVLASALGKVRPVDRAVIDGLAHPAVPAAGRVLHHLAASLMSNGEPFMLLLDNLHMVSTVECRKAINFLVDCLPPGRAWSLRAAGTGFYLPTRRLSGDVLELRSDRLAFTAEEAAKLLAGAGVICGHEASNDLRCRTEGWPAGLYLAALAMRKAPIGEGQGVPGGLLLAHNDLFIGDYLRSQVLSPLSQAERWFLTRTSVLDRLCGPLCDHLLGSTRSRNARIPRALKYIPSSFGPRQGVVPLSRSVPGIAAGRTGPGPTWPGPVPS